MEADPEYQVIVEANNITVEIDNEVSKYRFVDYSFVIIDMYRQHVVLPQCVRIVYLLSFIMKAFVFLIAMQCIIWCVSEF